MDELIRELVHLGLSEKEAAVYLAALELGPAPVQDIARKSQVNRATTYVMINLLSGRGLMSTFVKGKKRYYSAETPDRLRTVLSLQRTHIEKKEEDLGRVMPMLLALFNVEGAKPQIRYMEGPEGLLSVRNLFLSLKGEFVQVVPADDVEPIPEVVKDQPRHYAKLAQSDAAYRALLVMKDPDFSKVPVLPGGETRLLSAEKFPIHAEVTVRENHVFLYSYKSSVLAVVIVSKEIADVVRTMFDLAWAGAASAPSRVDAK